MYFGILAGRCGSVVVLKRERLRDQDMKGPGSRSRFDPGLRFFFFLIETLSITGQKFSKCLKMAATVYERDSCVGASVFWSCSLKGHGRFERAVVGKLPILFFKNFFFLLFAETPLIETSFALYGDVPGIKCRNV